MKPAARSTEDTLFSKLLGANEIMFTFMRCGLGTEEGLGDPAPRIRSQHRTERGSFQARVTTCQTWCVEVEEGEGALS